MVKVLPRHDFAAQLCLFIGKKCRALEKIPPSKPNQRHCCKPRLMARHPKKAAPFGSWPPISIFRMHWDRDPASRAAARGMNRSAGFQICRSYDVARFADLETCVACPIHEWLPSQECIRAMSHCHRSLATGFNKMAVIGGTSTVNCPFVADSTACTPPFQEPSGVIGAPPIV